MPTSKDLKRLVRARMHKTGEAYTAARAQIINRKTRPAVVAPVAVVEASPPPPEKPDYAAIAGMADEKVKEKTGCDWEKWVYALDRKKAYELSHRELTELIRTKYKVTDWWTQMVAVGYERIKGMRAKGQRIDGSYSASKSKTLNVPAATVFAAFAETRKRNKWLGEKVKVRKATPPKGIRLEQDGSIIAVWLESRSAGKTAVSIQEDNLPSQEASVEVKKYWGEKLEALKEFLEK